MKIVKHRTVLLIALLFVAVFSAFAFGISLARTEDDDELSFSGSINETYLVGETFNVPEAKYGNETAEFIVYLPDGTATRSDSLVLSQSGNYSVEYLLVTSDNRIIAKTITFNVLSTMFSVEGNGYVEYLALPNGMQGVYANIEKDSALVYNGIIDLTKISASDFLFKFFALPAVAGEADTNGIEIKLTDAYDDSRYISVRFKKRNESDNYDYIVSYLDCSFNGGTTVGLEINDRGKYEYGGNKYTAHVNNEKFGSNFTFSITGGKENSPAYVLSGISYDEETGLIYAKNYANTVYSVLISDVSNIDLYGEKFSGFTDGKVKLSITPYNMIKSKCGLFFSEICGEPITKDNYNQFTSEFYPEISVDFGKNEGSVPNAKAGRTYELFNATAFDIVDGYLDVNTEVYYGYENKHKIRVNVSDGSFVADKVGEYTIVYSATNSFGKSSQKLVRINSVKDFAELDLALENEIDYNIPVRAGSSVKLFDGYSAVNNFGASDFSVSVNLKGDKSVFCELDGDFSFKPLYSGEYEIIYTFSDYIDERTISETLTVTEGEAVHYETVRPFNKYYIYNGQYDVNNVKAYSLESGSPVEVPVRAYYSADGSDMETEITGLLKIPYAEKITLIYKPVVGFDTTPFRKDVSVVNTGYGTGTIDKSKYFKATTGQASFTANPDNVICDFVVSESGVISFDFVNVLARNEFSLNLESYTENGVSDSFGRLNLYLEDYLNPKHVVKFSLYKEDGVWFACVNDGNPLKFMASWGAAGDILNFAFDAVNKVFSLNDALSFNVSNFYQTETPVAFEQGLYLNVEFIDVKVGGGIKIKNVNGQIFNDSVYDGSAPTIDVAHYNHAGEKTIGTEIVVGGFYAFDVLSPDTVAYLTVRNNNKTVKSVDGVSLNKVEAKDFYKIILSEYGTYSVIVTYSDGENEKTKSCGNIIVEDKTPPEVTLKSKTSVGKVNKEVKLAEFSVNLEESKYDYFYAVFAPNARVSYVTDKTFIPEIAGTYEIHLFVFDENYNLTELVYPIVVE